MPLTTNFDPKELIDVAEGLKNSPEESKIRTVMNRCYYACYLTIKENRGFTLPSEKFTHVGAYRSASRKSNEASSLYVALCRFRVAADYGLTQDPDVGFDEAGIDPSKVNISVKNSKRVVAKAKKFLRLYGKKV